MTMLDPILQTVEKDGPISSNSPPYSTDIAPSDYQLIASNAQGLAVQLTSKHQRLIQNRARTLPKICGKIKSLISGKLGQEQSWRPNIKYEYFSNNSFGKSMAYLKHPQINKSTLLKKNSFSIKY